MANSKITSEQKQELIETLKFTPRDVNIILSGYGGEIVVGTVDRKAYDYFEENDIDLDEFANDWDNDLDIPEDMQPFTPGEWHDCDNLAHETGVEMSDLCYITVVDASTGETLFESGLDPSNLDDQGVMTDCYDEVYAEHHKGQAVFVGQSVEKGTFFEGTVRITRPFDPTKLSLTYCDIEGWLLCHTVEYDGEEIEGMDGYSTTGKSMEMTLKLIDENGDPMEEHLQEAADAFNEVFADELATAKLVDFTEDHLTDWFDKDVVPTINGEYEVLVEGATWPHTGPRRAKWDGKNWKTGILTVKITKWRGLNYNPDEE